ncbi:protein-cysteine N-palmitoyltransferase Rasp [Toxorhynchites rutilus septentrionalis]|uniref:protein-cysteine N-palmitoyltransferase Rasp n=1 Tax=Toxorhynchites rutilus septentrionalis TaxID=329112 RepID=UPI00247A100B|nr:protein-cysteine N-palmitoyltransferase Rasp [Toxorhynchites rutilus septentrionalis]XP_055638566.1 protein-cysteine N-palmitoyltransferase Rasp [Toxorhynchites rutilus septentrionalis]XP_055638567.1 protein-cysteine N-palmitoyltransferase Rasp [Toxorhynchites rutilus septentrionalis]XP_055638568.1 protein-cysteine N-palmitoyltransferase Rasp [Toxorhynchites rutilus septentrionalis]
MWPIQTSADAAVCIVLYIACLLYSFYKNYEISDDRLQNYYYLEEGWSVFKGRRRDDYDWEWEIYKKYAISNAVIFLIHGVIFEAIRILRVKRISLILATFGGVAILHIYGYKVLFILLFQNLTFFALNYWLTSITLLWVKAFLWIALINSIKILFFYDKLNVLLDIDNDKLLEFSIIISWNVIKCTCFCLERSNTKANTKDFRLIDMLGYSFYFPLLLYGPVIIYDRFKECHKISGPFENTNRICRLKKLVIRLLICYFWALVMEAGQHFFYINIIQLDVELLQRVNLWVLYGLGYLMGQFFYVKYVVFYGIGIAFGSFDGVEMPQKPICIGRVHLYSDMWKYFDRGLYEFLFKYIYTQLCTKTSSHTRKVLASSITFIFIYIWHGLYTFILIWSALNWICIVLEGFVKNIFGSNTRLNALVGTHVFILSVLSNFFFFAREEVGYIYIERTYFESLNNYLALYVVAYCFYTTGAWFRSVESQYGGPTRKTLKD